MTTVNYPSPVMVNGYACKNCTDVDYARKHIDPQNPRAGPYGVDAKDQPPRADSAQPSSQTAASDPTSGDPRNGVTSTDRLTAQRTATQGHRLDILV